MDLHCTGCRRISRRQFLDNLRERVCVWVDGDQCKKVVMSKFALCLYTFVDLRLSFLSFSLVFFWISKLHVKILHHRLQILSHDFSFLLRSPFILAFFHASLFVRLVTRIERKEEKHNTRQQCRRHDSGEERQQKKPNNTEEKGCCCAN